MVNRVEITLDRVGALRCASFFGTEAGRAEAAIFRHGTAGEFRYPTYIQEFMGDIFSLGFGPFRWVCTSNAPADLRATDAIAATVLRRMRTQSPPRVDEQLADNLLWIEQAERNQMVVGSQVCV